MRNAVSLALTVLAIAATAAAWYTGIGGTRAGVAISPEPVIVTVEDAAAGTLASQADKASPGETVEPPPDAAEPPEVKAPPAPADGPEATINPPNAAESAPRATRIEPVVPPVKRVQPRTPKAVAPPVVKKGQPPKKGSEKAAGQAARPKICNL